MARAKAEAKPETTKTKLWTPLPGPQTKALNSQADEMFFGGQAGGGKTQLGIGLALTAHRQSIFFRRELTQLQDVIDSTKEMLGDLARYNDAKHRFYDIPGNRTLEFGSIPNNNKLSAYKGRPHDLKVFDEVSDFTERQYRFLTGFP